MKIDEIVPVFTKYINDELELGKLYIGNDIQQGTTEIRVFKNQLHDFLGHMFLRFNNND